MEQEVVVPSTTMNGVEKTAPTPDDVTAKGKPDSIALVALLERREKLVQGLNTIKAEREALVQRVKELDISVARTEGAVYIIGGMIAEIDPQAAQQLGG